MSREYGKENRRGYAPDENAQDFGQFSAHANHDTGDSHADDHGCQIQPEHWSMSFTFEKKTARKGTPQ